MERDSKDTINEKMIPCKLTRCHKEPKQICAFPLQIAALDRDFHFF